MAADHELYRPSDFTQEELDLKNVLAVAVCETGLAVCKRCGATTSRILLPCRRACDRGD